jgi:tight adherence protein C
MPLVIDLMHLGVGSGLTVGAALRYVVDNVESPVCDVYRIGLAQVDQGRRLAEVLEDCEARLGVSAMSLTSALLSAERYGSPIGTTLAQLAHETRFDQERRAEQAARRLSVQLIFPLAGCILPAFALLTAAPLLAGSIGSLATSFH